MFNSQPNGRENPYVQSLPQDWTDVYVENNLRAQLFPGTDHSAVSFDRLQRQWVVNSGDLSPHQGTWQSPRSITPQPNGSSRMTAYQTVRPSTPQPAISGALSSGSNVGIVLSPKAQVTPEMAESARAFREAVAKFKQSTKVAITLDLDTPGTWDDLLNDVKQVEQKYKLTEARSGSHKFTTLLRKGFRNIAKFDTGMQSWLRLVPDGAFGEANIVTGGLRVILEAASKLESMRDETYDIIEQIPQTLDNADRFARYYRSADSLQQMVSKLYVAVLEALTIIISWYQQSSARHAASALLKGSGYGDRLRECLKGLQVAGQAVTTQGNVEMHGQIHGMVDSLSEVSGTTQETRNMLDCICNGMNFQTDLLRDQSMMFNTIISEIMYVRHQREQERKMRMQQQLEQMQQNIVRQRRILDEISYDADFILCDLQWVLQKGLAFDRTSQGFAAFTLQSDQVKWWLNMSIQAPLIVNAHLDQYDRVSSISLFSSMLVRLLEKMNNGVVLSWFCSVHTEDNDCTAMLPSLIGQILNSNCFNVNSLDENFDYLTYTLHQYMLDFDLLIKVLKTLIRRQLTYTPVFIVIDSISVYESNAFFQEASIILQALSSLCMETRDSKNHIKLLLTSPKAITAFGEIFDSISGRETLDLSVLRFANASSYTPVMSDLLS